MQHIASPQYYKSVKVLIRCTNQDWRYPETHYKSLQKVLPFLLLRQVTPETKSRSWRMPKILISWLGHILFWGRHLSIWSSLSHMHQVLCRYCSSLSVWQKDSCIHQRRLTPSVMRYQIKKSKLWRCMISTLNHDKWSLQRNSANSRYLLLQAQNFSKVQSTDQRKTYGITNNSS